MSGELSDNDGSDSVFGDHFDPSETSEDEWIEFMTSGSVTLRLSSARLVQIINIIDGNIACGKTEFLPANSEYFKISNDRESHV